MRIFFILITLFFLPHANADAKISSADFFVETPTDLGVIMMNHAIHGMDASSADLCAVANNVQQYMKNYAEDTFAVHRGTIASKFITLSRVKRTLAFLCKIQEQDIELKQTSRLSKPQFLMQHFDFIRWMPDKQKAENIAKNSGNEAKKQLLNNIPNKEIFLTKYYTKLLQGSVLKTDKYNQALYALPFDEKGLTLVQAEQKKSALTRYLFTRQQIISGALETPELAQPLVWITEAALHDVLLQGTGIFMVDGKKRYFNVHRNNGIAYNYAQNKTAQARYWYFIETPEIMGYGITQASKIAIKPQVSVAGNIAELGLGKLFMLSYNSKGTKVSRMAILADEGGAFDNNLFQLDLLVDSYKGWHDYHQQNKQLPDYARAWIMLLKE